MLSSLALTRAVGRYQTCQKTRCIQQMRKYHVSADGGDHIYGIAPVRLAFEARRRNFKELIVQEAMFLANKKDEKSATEIMERAKELDISVREMSKIDMNKLCDNRPHQGFILRATKLNFEEIVEMSRINEYKVVLALDEVWDPQNFGALIR